VLDPALKRVLGNIPRVHATNAPAAVAITHARHVMAGTVSAKELAKTHLSYKPLIALSCFACGAPTGILPQLSCSVGVVTHLPP
jgi:hypothetical protein